MKDRLDHEDAAIGATIALVTLRETIDQEPDWDRDEILNHIANVVRLAPLGTDVLEVIHAVCLEDE